MLGRKYLAASCVTLAALCLTTTALAQVPINIESTPPGATVYVDATSTAPLGTTPIRAARVARGSHTLIFRMEGYEEGRLPVNVARRRETFRIVLTPMGTLVVTAGNEGAQGAAVRLDGQPVGNVPYRQVVRPGRYMVQVGREGFATFSQWIEIAGGQVLTLPVLLEQERPQTGSILVASDISGAPIYLDGEPRGSTPTVIDNVTAGQHRLEIRPQGAEVHTETVTVIAGQRTSVNPVLRAAPAAGGTIRVMANVPGAVVSLDGTQLGPVPVTRENVAPGEHILEATAEGYLPSQQPITVAGGRSQVFNIELRRGEAGAGRIVVNTAEAGATVTVDGEDRGAPPVVIQNAAPGPHAIIVRAPGFEDFRETCTVGPGRNCEINARLEPQGVPVQVNVNSEVRNAELLVDGETRGPVPFEGTLPVGQHRIEVRAEGFEPHIEQIQLVASTQSRIFNVRLRRSGPTDEERQQAAEELEQDRYRATAHSAGALPSDFATLDLSVGWPYTAELRLNVGILSFLEAGFATRSFGRLTEFEGRVEFGLRPVRQIAVAAQARFGGGLGFTREFMEGMEKEEHSTNTWFFIAEALTTLHFSDLGAFTLWLGLDSYTDRYDFSSRNSDALANSGEISRQAQTRVRLGGSLEFVMSRHWNAWGLIEGVLLGPDEPRRILGDIYGFGKDDTELYARFGFTYKF